jgi:hypothetical protein
MGVATRKNLFILLAEVLLLTYLIFLQIFHSETAGDLSKEQIKSCPSSFDQILIHSYRISSNNFYEVCPTTEKATSLSSELVQSPGIYKMSFSIPGRDPIVFSVDARKPGL